MHQSLYLAYFLLLLSVTILCFLFFPKQGQVDEAASVLPAVKRRKGPEEAKDEHALSESSLNKIVGAADVYNLEVIYVSPNSIIF